MRIDVFTIFPDLVGGFCSHSLLGRAQRNGILELRLRDLRSAATDPHQSVDDTPFGGGAGMVLMPQPIFDAVEAAQPPRPLYFLGPAGHRFDQRMAEELASLHDPAASGAGFSLLCGRYEGVDARVTDHLCDGEISLGDFVLGGGEVAACTVIEAVTRLLPGVMGNHSSADDESFSADTGLLEHPQYTKPADFRGWRVPEVLRSGDHGKVDRWRRCQAILRTLARRPDLVSDRGGIFDEEWKWLREFGVADEAAALIEDTTSLPLA